MQEFDEIWQLTLQELNKQFSNATMSVWFKDTSLKLLTDTHAVVYIESNFKCEMLQKNHAQVIADTLEGVLGYRPELIITSDKNFTVPSGGTVSDKAEQSKDAAFTDTDISSRGETKEEQDSVRDEADTERTEEKKDASAPSAPEPSFFDPGETNNLAYYNHSSEYTFDNFIVGSSNKFAHAACISVAKNPAHSYNPLFIYGPSGLGKTHLLYAIINEIHKNNPDYKIIYVKGDEFTNQMIESIRNGKTAEFREKFRKADVLLIDDIHFIAGKEGTQEEFFHTFNDLYEHRKQIILTSDRPAKDIQHLEDRLRTRFEWGLPADIQPPDFELRVAIMQNKANALGSNFSVEVLNFLAEKLTNNVRQMEGAIKRIIAYSHLTREDITISLVNNCISDLLSNNGAVKITPEMIIEKVAEKYKVNPDDLFSKKRTSGISNARHVCIYLIKKLLDQSTTAIGKRFNRDHTTIMHSLEAIETNIKIDSSFEMEINEIINSITGR